MCGICDSPDCSEAAAIASLLTPAVRSPAMAERKRRTGIRPQRKADRDPRPRRKRGLRPGPADRGRGRGRTVFDGFAEGVTRVVSSAYFFASCIAAVVAWALFGPPLGFSNTWQLVINTATTIVTFLMVAVLQNSSRRGEKAIQHKLDAIADALADFMDKADIELDEDVRELEEAVGLEEREGSR